jgi:hydroxyacylglutathione hydrolase
MGQLSAIIVPVTLFQQNCTLMFDAETRQGVVVDPGGDVDKIAAALAANKIILEAIWITHGHLDHAGGAMELKERFGVSIIGPHEADKFILDNIEMSAAAYGAAGKMLNCTPDQFLVEGDTVAFGGHVFEVLHCPGHSPGHVVFYNRAEGFAHVGDVLFHGSIGRTDFKGGDHAALISSIKNKLLPLGDEIGFICGHGPGGKFGEERRTNPYLLA